MAVTPSCRLKNTLLLLLVCLAVAPSILAKPVRYCDRRANYGVKVKKVEISPDPVKPGENAVFKIFASTGKGLSKGNVEIDVSFFGIPVHKETIDLCAETSCPIAAGDFVLSHSQTLPSYTPPGSYTLKMRIEDSDKQLQTCISFGFKISLGSSVADI